MNDIASENKIVLTSLQDLKENSLPLRYYPDPILNEMCEDVEEINDEIRTLVKRMYLTMIKSNGIGIAAPQVGRLLNIFITDTDFGRYGIKKSNPLIFINPTIINTSEETALREEGCLSFPGVYSNVRRNTEIQIQALNYEGNHFTLDFFDFEAACHLHEYSHLQGKTIREYLGVPERSRVLNNIKKIQRENKRNNK